ncbi:hypothetical protein [Rhodococcus sp. IEGM 1318]|uniref:hypothetical protein n=1 Tax=Rhodococcus sp. IEGM 1318 TaxID=3082226 RepID=UPI00295405D0|nr:hypothetical protein [Rhodococcus sp. IEGM 1318]MDV8006916.1 hypothetical protein [Rhodococcus sp. IEGM 1318]
MEPTVEAWTRADTFQPAAATRPAPLRDSNGAPLRDSNGELLETLSTYLDEESSLAHTAK